MATRIEAAATACHLGRIVGRGALYLSDEAARRCLARAGRSSNDLDLLINTGIYRDHNLAEPALASIIQEDLGANPGHPPRFGHHGTFSFDLANGGCGVITALQLVDGFVGDGTARCALIVAGDADPAPWATQRFPFAPAGGAILLVHVPGDDGFRGFAIRTFPEDGASFAAEMRWHPRGGLLKRGRNVVEISESPQFAARCRDLGGEVVRELLARLNLGIDDVDLLVASQYPVDFAATFARQLGLPNDRVPWIPYQLARTHTAGVIAALEAAIRSGQLARAQHALLVTAGAGPTIAAAVYRG